MSNFFYKILLVLSLGLILPQAVLAAQIFFDPNTVQARVGERFEIMVFLNSEQDSLNAFEGQIVWPKDILDFKEIRDGNSIVNFWIDKPKNQNNIITFSGVTPGGYKGEKGLILSAVFEAKQEGAAKLEINNARVLRNDGLGSTANLTTPSLEVAVLKGVSTEIPRFSEIKDYDSPESFVPEIARDESMFNGQWFIVFATQDKVSGIDHYEIKESRQKFFAIFKKWLTVQSPYVLTDQELRSFVWIKAVDKTGNERLRLVEPRYPLVWYNIWWIWSIIILGLLVLAVVGKILWKKRGK